MCTGSGKSKVALDYINYLSKTNDNLSVLLVVPTEKLRDENWNAEYMKWSSKELYNKTKRVCYASLNKILNQHYDVIILDEVHRLTTNNSEFFNNNTYKSLVGLTATIPKEEDKLEVLRSLDLQVIFNLSLDEGVKLGVVSPFTIKIVEMFLDNKEKYVSGGNKDKPFKTTEYKHYEYISRQIQRIQFSGKEVPKFLYLNRMRFLYNVKSKTELAKKLLNTVPQEDKTIIFCGSIEQAEQLCTHHFHSKKDDSDLKLFMEDKIKRLSCVKALNEGMNIPNIDTAVIVQVDSNDLNLIQRLGRACRYREGHQAEIYIISVLETQDQKWVEKALKFFNKENIEYINAKNI